MAVPTFDSRDVSQNKVLGGLGYLLPFVPVFACPGSKFGKYCANQGLLFWLVLLAVQLLFWILGLVFGWVPVLGSLLAWVGYIARAAVFLLELYYMIMAMTKGQAKEVPIIGGFSLIR